MDHDSSGHLQTVIKYASGILPKCDVRSKRKFHEYSGHAQQKIHSFSTARFCNEWREQSAPRSREMGLFEPEEGSPADEISTGKLSTGAAIYSFELSVPAEPGTAIDATSLP
jgi:hypothetical protein